MWKSHPGINICIERLFTGGVIAYPTEAVWGLGCDPFNEHAVRYILKLKNRHPRKGLILVGSEIDQFDFILDGVSPDQLNKLNNTWPGHHTWLVPHHDRISPWVCGEHPTIALRVSTHPIIRALCDGFGSPIVSTSANPQGMQPATSNFTARRYFLGRNVTFAPGTIGSQAKPSTIQDLSTGKIIR